MLYAEYRFYEEQYLAGHSAAVKERDWMYYSRKAGQYIDECTSGRIDPDNVPDPVRFCTCELVEILAETDSTQQDGVSGPMTGYSNDGQSASFATDPNSIYTQAGKSRAMRSIVRKYLARTGLLYTGGGAYAVES